MGRRTNEQICVDLRKERSRIYSKRSRLIKKPSTNANNKKLQSLNKRLDAIKQQLFRCGKKYSKLKKEKNKLKRHNVYLKSKVKKLNEDYSNKKISKTELNKKKTQIYKEQRATLQEVRDVEKAMDLPLITYDSGVGIVSLGKGEFAGTAILWKLRDMMRQWLQSGMFELIVIDGEYFDIDNELLIWVKVDEAEMDAMAFQDVNPFYALFYYYADPSNYYLEIKIKDFVTVI